MSVDAGPLAEYLRALRRELAGNAPLARRVLEEVEDHLAEAVAAYGRAGMSQHEAEENAVARFGPPEPFARGLKKCTFPLGVLVAVASFATLGVAIWLLYVVTAVLPSRDPAHVPMWRTVAIAFSAYSALCWACLVAGPRVAVLRGTFFAASLLAIGLGVYGVANMIQVGLEGGHFEGYIVLMGLILAGHGFCAFLYSMVSRRIA